MVAVLGRCQDKLGFGQIARVEIDWPRFFPGLRCLEFVFPDVGLKLRIHNEVLLDQFGKSEQLFLQTFAHRFRVEARFRKIETRAAKLNRSPALDCFLDRPIERTFMTAGNRHQTQHGTKLADFTHSLVSFRKDRALVGVRTGEDTLAGRVVVDQRNASWRDFQRLEDFFHFRHVGEVAQHETAWLVALEELFEFFQVGDFFGVVLLHL